MSTGAITILHQSTHDRLLTRKPIPHVIILRRWVVQYVIAGINFIQLVDDLTILATYRLL